METMNPAWLRRLPQFINGTSAGVSQLNRESLLRPLLSMMLRRRRSAST